MNMKHFLIQSMKDEISHVEWFDSAHDQQDNFNVHNFEHFDL